MSDKKSILVGYSGHGLVVAETAIDKGILFEGYAEKNTVTANPFNLAYIGFENDENFVGWSTDVTFVLGIGNNSIRQKVADLIASKSKKCEIVIHQSASISKTTTIGNGTFVNRNVSVNCFCKIGKNVILNTACVIDHECNIGDAAHIAPGAVLAGNVSVGAATFIGANSVVKQGISIGKNATIGAGAVVVKNIADNEVWFGNPARKIS